jgi:hypothetical protein
MSRIQRRLAMVFAVLAVVIGIAFAGEVRLNRPEPWCGHSSRTFGCAERSQHAIELPAVMPPDEAAQRER